MTMTGTKVELGTGKGFLIKHRAKFKPPHTGFCNSPTCLSEVQLDDNGRCLRCFNVVTRGYTFHATKKRFDLFLEKNSGILEHFIFAEPGKKNLKIPIILYKRIYYVPLRYFYEYQNLVYTNEFLDDKGRAYQNFFDVLKGSCDSEKL